MSASEEQDDSKQQEEQWVKQKMELIANKAEIELDRNKPFEKYLQSMDVLFEQANLQLENDAKQLYYIQMMRYVQLVLGKAEQHPEYSKHKGKLKTHHQRLPGAVQNLEKVKENLREQYRREYRQKLAERKAEIARIETEKAKEAERIKSMEVNTMRLGDHLNGGMGHIGAGDALVMEGLKNLPSTGHSAATTRNWNQSGPAGYSGTYPSNASGPRHGEDASEKRVRWGEDEVFTLGVPLEMNEDSVPVLLPNSNRMSWNTFVESERRRPALQPTHPASRSVNSAPSSQHYDADLAEALRISANMHRHETSKMDKLKERLEKFTEYELEDVDNSGHCQFDAIAHQINGRFQSQYCRPGQSYHYRDVRRDIANWLRKHEEFVLENGAKMSEFHDTEDGRDWAEFCNNIEDIYHKPAPTWGNHLTLIAAANLYQRPIRVWSTAPGDDWWLQIEPKFYKPKEHEIRPFELAHLYERHYMSVRERKGAVGISRLRNINSGMTPKF
mmetsp:Transcript_4437/g.7151  ORF Transcript_4437/g.7151 Transcript_4437/m.7151 type:complete len:501 (-) Transcript_4437:46-1548(-)